MMATPMIVLYNLSILLSWYVTRKREKKDAELRARERRDDVGDDDAGE
jgi:Sec-independent protein secretion pathway component TatC